MIKIGDFSKLVGVPILTLRYYDQVGLLKPIQVDPMTGYRYYSASQLPRLHRILALKGLGFSLEQIAVALTEGLTAGQMRGMLRLRHAQISQEIVDVKSQLREVEMRLQQIESEDQVSTYDVVLKPVEPVLIAAVRTILPAHNAITPLYAEVYDAILPHVNEALIPDVGGQTMAIWYDEEYKAQDVYGAAAFILRHRVPDSGRTHVHELPATTMATTIHEGSYNTLTQAHEAILTWIEANQYHIVGPSREIYLHSTLPIDHDNPAYVTEVQFPVEKRLDAD